MIKDAKGLARSYLSNRANWEASGKKKGKPGWPAANDHPTLVLRAHAAELHIPQVKKIVAKKVIERKHDPDLVTVAIDLGVKNLAVITVRQHDKVIETVFVRDHGLDAHRYRHLGRIANVCAKYPGCILLFERLRKIKPGPGSKSRRDGPQTCEPVTRQNQSACP